MPQVKRTDVEHVLAISDKEHGTSHAKDIDLIVKLTKILNASLEMGKSADLKPGAMATALVKKGLNSSKIAESATGSQALGAVNQVVGQGAKTVGMTKFLQMTSPSKVGAAAALTVVEKVVMAGGMAGMNKCRMAVAQLSATTGLTALSIGATAPTGIGAGISAAVGAIAIAADMFQVYGACYADGKDGKDLVFL